MLISIILNESIPGSNLLSALSNTINDLKNYKSFTKEEVKINYNGFGTNLHSFFDSGIIKAKDISLQDCLKSNKFSTAETKNIQRINVQEWATQSRSNLEDIYNFNGHIISDDYVNKNAIVIENQLLIGGLRLASVLNETFK